VTDPSFENHRWYTPLRGQPGYQASYQDYGRLVASASVVYASAQLNVATVTVIALHRDSSVHLSYSFDGVVQVCLSFPFIIAIIFHLCLLVIYYQADSAKKFSSPQANVTIIGLSFALFCQLRVA
jgi:hypothetical protein